MLAELIIPQFALYENHSSARKALAILTQAQADADPAVSFDEWKRGRGMSCAFEWASNVGIGAGLALVGFVFGFFVRALLVVGGRTMDDHEAAPSQQKEDPQRSQSGTPRA